MQLGSERYYPISRFYRERFGQKVYKVSVSVVESCPNRHADGGGSPCIFCDEWGSAAYHLESHRSLLEQITTNRQRIAERYRAERFLVYFQAYTNTFARTQRLKENFTIALQQPGVVGLVLGTRPDTLPARVINLLAEYAERGYLGVELGVQSFDDSSLQFLQRGHDNRASLSAIERLAEVADIDIGIHLIFGLPDEDDETIVETARQVNALPISNVKLHNLHVLSNTPLADLYHRGQFMPLELPEYARRVALFLSHLRADIAVHRLAAVANRWDELIAPAWNREKMRPSQTILDRLIEEDVWQGKVLGYTR